MNARDNFLVAKYMVQHNLSSRNDYRFTLLNTYLKRNHVGYTRSRDIFHRGSFILIKFSINDRRTEIKSQTTK